MVIQQFSVGFLTLANHGGYLNCFKFYYLLTTYKLLLVGRQPKKITLPMYTPYTYLVVLHFKTCLPLYKTHFLRHGLPS